MHGRKIIKVIVPILVVAGLACALFPVLGAAINSSAQGYVVDKYDATAAKLDGTQKAQALAEAQAYNATVDSGLLDDPTAATLAAQASGYNKVLNVAGDGIMGTLSVPKLNLRLPIYHGIGDDVLAKGVGHLEGSALPVGGEGTHCVLTGHRGLPSSELFTHLDKLQSGDTFSVQVLDETLTYQVDQIRTVLPEETKDLQPVPGKEYLTLVTCTPYGVNDHRLLVRGVRVSAAPQAALPSSNQEHQVEGLSLLPLGGAMIGVGIGTLVVALRMPAWRRKRREKR